MVFKLDKTILVPQDIKVYLDHRFQNDSVTAVAISGNRIVSTHKTSKPKVWDVGTGKILHELETEYIPDLVAVAGNRIVIGQKANNLIEIWNSDTGVLERPIDFDTHYDDGRLSSIAINSDGTRIVCGIDKDMMMLNADTGESINKDNAYFRVTSVAIDKYSVFGRGYQEDAIVWTGTKPNDYLLEDHSQFVTCVATAGDLVVTGSEDTTVKVWDAKIGKLIRTLKGHTNQVITVAIAGSIVVSISKDAVKVWNANTGALIQTWTMKPISSNYSLAFDGDRIVIGCTDNNIKVWTDVKATAYSLLATTKRKNDEYKKSVLDKTTPKDDDIAFRLLESNAVQAEIDASVSHLRELEKDKAKTEKHLREFEMVKSGTNAFRYDRFIFTKPPNPPHGIKLKPSLYLGLPKELQDKIMGDYLTGKQVNYSKGGGTRTKKKKNKKHSKTRR